VIFIESGKNVTEMLQNKMIIKEINNANLSEGYLSRVTKQKQID